MNSRAPLSISGARIPHDSLDIELPIQPRQANHIPNSNRMVYDKAHSAATDVFGIDFFLKRLSILITP
jgi:hypothetical protein